MYICTSVCVLTIYSMANVSALKRGDFLPLHNANLSERVCACVCECYSPLGPGPLVLVLGETPVSAGRFCCNETKGKHE